MIRSVTRAQQPGGHRRKLRFAHSAGLVCAAMTLSGCAWSASHEAHTGSSELVDSLAASGLTVPNPLDTTALECRTVGCAQSVVTDTLRITSFPTIAQAEGFATPRGLYQSGRFVVAFAPPLTEADRVPYRMAIQRLTD